jgi:hypothetical protein
VLDDYRMVILGSFGGSFWTIISKVPPIPLVFGKMGFKKVLKMTPKVVILGHPGVLSDLLFQGMVQKCPIIGMSF